MADHNHNDDHSRLSVAENDIAYLKMRLNNIEVKLDRLLAILNSAKGVWWFVVVMAIVASSITGWIMAAWDKIAKNL